MVAFQILYSEVVICRLKIRLMVRIGIKGLEEKWRSKPGLVSVQLSQLINSLMDQLLRVQKLKIMTLLFTMLTLHLAPNISGSPYFYYYKL